jgi:hypothetical protein
MKLTPEQLEDRRRNRARNQQLKRMRELAHALIDKGFQQQARRCHPDAGGSNEAMFELAAVRDRLHEAVGDGKQKRSFGWFCRGSLFS